MRCVKARHEEVLYFLAHTGMILTRRVPKLVSGAVSMVVREVVDEDLSLQDALSRDYANLSAVARLVVPRIEERNGTSVNLQSVITALKRLRSRYAPASRTIFQVIAESTVNVRTDVAKISLEKTRKTIEGVRRLLSEHQEDFLQISESLTAVTIILDEKALPYMKKSLGNDYLELESELAAIIVHSTEEIIKTPGCAIAFYNQLSRRHINIEDTVSCYTDTIIIVHMNEASGAFAALSELISEARRTNDRREKLHR